MNRHLGGLQYLALRDPGGAPHRSEAALTELQEEAERLQQRALDRGTHMQETLQSWTQWEEDSCRSDALLRRTETSLLEMQTEQQPSQKLAVLQDLRLLLEENDAAFSHMLEAGRRLQGAGCGGVGVATDKLDARWKSLTKRVELERTTTERKRRLRNRFVRDAAALTDWMLQARESIKTWREFTASSDQTERRRDVYLQAVALSAELEGKSELKVSLMSAAAQLEQLRTAGGDAGGGAGGQTEDESTQLSQLQLDFSSLQAELPVVQQTLQKLWMESQSQQEALQQLQVWITAAESGLEEHRRRINQNSFTCSDLSPLLKYCKERQVEMSSHQDILDFVNQPLQACSTQSDQRRRSELNGYAEQQGLLNQAWLCLQGTISSQVQDLEQELRSRLERGARLQQVDSWIAEQNIWMGAAESAGSRTELQRSIDRCQDVQEKVQLKSAALQDLRGRVCGGNGNSDFLRQTDESIQACVALTQRAESVKQKLIQDQQLWSSVENRLQESTLRAARTSQTLELYGCPQICLQAHRRLHDRLQLLQQQVSASDSELDRLTRLVSSLRGNIRPAAAAVLDGRLQRLRSRWTEVCVTSSERLQASGSLLQMWQLFSSRAASLSQRLQRLQSAAAAVPVEIDGLDDGVQRGAEHVHTVETLLQESQTLQSHLEEVLQASKQLIGQLEPPAAALVQSESRLLSRGVLQLRERLGEKLGRLQEDLRRLQDFGADLDSVEENLEEWTRRLETGAARQVRRLMNGVTE